MKVGILGYGEVGQAIAKFYENPKVKDLNRDDGLEDIDILHICIPWDDNFVEAVSNEICQIEPMLSIIHSTVEPFTTLSLYLKLKYSIVHSPIRGLHPNLYEEIKVFTKYIGYHDTKSKKLAEEHFESLGIKTKSFRPSVITELGKLFSTTSYGLYIAWHGEMKKICDEYEIDFEKVVTDFNITYNEGNKRLGRDNVIRPILYPPQKGIGGHCIIPNVEILNKCFKNEIFDLILKYKKGN